MLKYFAKNLFLQQRLFLSKGNYDLDRFFKTVQVSPYGGKLIRIGQDNDGGYLMPDCLDGIKGVFSPGVDTICDFELDMVDRLDIPIYACDYSVDTMPQNHPNFHFDKKFLGIHNNSPYMTLEKWANTHMTRTGDYILQMDIEAGEYDVLMHTDAEILRRFRIINIEFHHLEFLFNSISHKMIEYVFEKLLQDFKIIHAHPNNNDVIFKRKQYEIPSAMEFTFIRNDYYKQGNTLIFPHPLDTPNVSSKSDIPLPKCWYDYTPNQ